MTDPMTNATPPEQQAPTTAGQFVGGLIILGLGGAVVLVTVFMVFGWFYERSIGFAECKARTREMLLDPTSAHFGAPTTARAADDARVVRFRYSVSATNGFGGRIERMFTCIVDDSGKDRRVTVY